MVSWPVEVDHLDILFRYMKKSYASTIINYLDATLSLGLTWLTWPSLTWLRGKLVHRNAK